jgi:hypothetical protein
VVDDDFWHSTLHIENGGTLDSDNHSRMSAPFHVFGGSWVNDDDPEKFVHFTFENSHDLLLSIIA